MEESKSIRILILSTSLNRKGGVTNYINLLSKNLKSQKIQIQHFSQDPDHISYLYCFLYPIMIFYRLISLKKLIKEYKPDIIHINPSLLPLALARDTVFMSIAKMEKIPILLFIHGWNEFFFQIIKKNAIFTFFFKKICRATDAIVVLSNQFKKNLVELGVKENNIYVLSTMVNSRKYEPKQKIFRPPYKILFCSRMVKEKGPYELLEAAKIILDTYPETQFIFVGKGIAYHDLEKRTKELKIDSKVIFLGYIKDCEKINIFKESHIFAFPTYHGEGFPTVVLEAMAAGLPIITTPNAGLKDALNTRKQGFLLESMPAKPEEIAEKIIILLGNKRLLKEIAKNNVQEAKERYDVDIVTKKIENIYKKILNTRGQ